MPDLTTKEYLQPSLLDRLTDDNPTRKTDTLEERVMSFRRLRDSVFRDLEWLLNTACLSCAQDLEEYPEVTHSVINYGLPDLAGSWVVGKSTADMERDLLQAIIDFEPRILPATLQVRVRIDLDAMNSNTLTLEIQGELWWQPLPERFYVKSTLDVETGKFKPIN